MHLNGFGRAVQSVWDGLPKYYGNLTLDAFVVMPNHIHGILILNDVSGVVGPGLRPGPTKAHPVTQIVGSFKSFSARRINQLRGTPGIPVWQEDYWERVVREESELNAIREYIFHNPLGWDDDEENPTGDVFSRPGS